MLGSLVHTPTATPAPTPASCSIVEQLKFDRRWQRRRANITTDLNAAVTCPAACRKGELMRRLRQAMNNKSSSGGQFEVLVLGGSMTQGNGAGFSAPKGPGSAVPVQAPLCGWPRLLANALNDSNVRVTSGASPGADTTWLLRNLARVVAAAPGPDLVIHDFAVNDDWRPEPACTRPLGVGACPSENRSSMQLDPLGSYKGVEAYLLVLEQAIRAIAALPSRPALLMLQTVGKGRVCDLSFAGWPLPLLEDRSDKTH